MKTATSLGLWPCPTPSSTGRSTCQVEAQGKVSLSTIAKHLKTKQSIYFVQLGIKFSYMHTEHLFWKTSEAGEARTRQVYLLDIHERPPASFKTFAWLTPEMYTSTAMSPSATSALHQLLRAPRVLVSRSHRLYFSYAVRPDYSSSGLHQLYCAYAVHPDAPSRRSTSRQSVALALAMCPVILLCVVTTRLVAATDILRLRHASGCLGTSRGTSRGSSRASSRHLSSTTSPRAGSSSTTSPMSRVQVPRHVARLVTRLLVPLVVDYFASCRLVVDYFAFAACPGASARHTAHHAAHCRLLRAPRLRLAATLALLQPHRVW
jgi:hypothetical protein